MPSDHPPIRLHTGGFTFTNGYLLGGPGGTVGVDAPEGMADWLQDQGVKLDALLLTHWHFDHVVDAARLVREHGCQVYAWGPSTAETRLELYLQKWAGITYAVEDYPVTVPLSGLFDESAGPETRTIKVAGRQFRMEHVPGHSPDSIVFIEEEAGIIFSGDTLMQGGIGRSDFPDGDGELLLRGIREKILPLPGGWQVFSGHGRPTTVEAEQRSNPYLV